jgi:kinesin family protein 6/9
LPYLKASHSAPQVDPSAIIKRLKSEIRELKEELRLLKGDDAARGELTEGELERLRRQCEAYVADPDDDATIAWESMLHVRAAMSTFRRLCRGAGATTLGAAAGAGARPAIEAKVVEGGGEGGGVSDGVLAEQVRCAESEERVEPDDESGA